MIELQSGEKSKQICPYRAFIESSNACITNSDFPGYACLASVCSRARAIQLMEVNLAVLGARVAEAASQGAQIILLPEDGIHGYGHVSRETLR